VNDIRPVIPEHVNAPLRDLIRQCLDRNPDVHPTFDEIVDRFEADMITVDGAYTTVFGRDVQDTVGSKGHRGGSSTRS
jgi:hypothetical protein